MINYTFVHMRFDKVDKMARWKLTRITYGNNEEFTLLDGDEVTLGRGVTNNISLSSIVISRNHCVLNVQTDQVLITDLKSSNGVYVGLKKIPPNSPYPLQEFDIIGIGWTTGAPVANIKDTEKYMFKLTKDKSSSITSRLTFQSDNELAEIESELAAIDKIKSNGPAKNITPEKNSKNVQSPILNRNPAVKRRLEESAHIRKIKKEISDLPTKIQNDYETITISDSDNEGPQYQDNSRKKPKLEFINEEPSLTIKEEDVKIEKDDEYDAFKVKQEYLGYDDEPIQIDSDSDGESVQWLIRLSQSSPGKPLTKVAKESKPAENEENSYSQIDDFEEDFIDDLISIPPHPPEVLNQIEKVENKTCNKNSAEKIDLVEDEEFLDDLISLAIPQQTNMEIDVVDGSSKKINEQIEISSNRQSPQIEPQKDKAKKAQLIEPAIQASQSKSSTVTDSKHKYSSSSKHSKDRKHKNHLSSKRHITDSQKEERRQKLKEIATKEKNEKSSKKSNSTSKDKGVVNVKVTSTNRGAFLIDVAQVVIKPTKKNDSPQKSKGEKKTTTSPNSEQKKEITEDIENKKKLSDKLNSSRSKGDNKSTEEKKLSKHKDKDSCQESSRSKSRSTSAKPNKARKSSSVDTENEDTTIKHLNRVPLKSLKPLSESEESFSGKPFSKVEPLPTFIPTPSVIHTPSIIHTPSVKSSKPKKTVRFSEEPPLVRVFEIEEGNSLKKTSSVKSVDIRQTPVFSLEKIFLMRILRWNPHWLEEQINLNDPPPILGANPPMTMFHSFTSHSQYVQLVGDLLLMEIWEYLTQGYMRLRGQNNGLPMRIASLPPVSSQDRCFELFNMSVNVSTPHSESRKVPRMGEVLVVEFGPECTRNKRFFYVHNVRILPSPANNKNCFYDISLHTCYTEKMKALKPGELIVGFSLAYIHNELQLFEAMEYLAGSPLVDAILCPEPRHFIKCQPTDFPVTPWTSFLNPSQQIAVHSSVTAALGDRPCIEMVQGPPGTGKSSVICAIVMTYFFDVHGKKQQNRGKILICATSNAAVDELVIRLLTIRQKLPKLERFKMVRVGRTEAMHPRARDISSQQLAQRDASSRHSEPMLPGVTEEISHLEAKVNMWKTQELDAKDLTRAAYCRGRVKALQERINFMRAGVGGGGGGGTELRAGHLAEAERRIIEGADIIVTTLGSACNNKMKGLRRKIALCIIDEAGQAIEPETLIPLTLDVTKVTLIGDPQQLPGYICSQRAKKHGLGESLFYRLTSCTEHWAEGSPVILLNQQYRMQAAIADYPNRAFYAGKILSMPPPRPNLEIPPYSIVCVSSGDKGQVSSGANELEAWGVARIVLALYVELRQANLSLAVITPYNAHKELIKRNLKLLQDPSESHIGIEVNTVDSFQGQERDVVVVSLARSHGLGFLADAGRMNVMLTRARHALLLCLNPVAVTKNFQWRTLVEDALKRQLYRCLPNKICQGISAGPIPHTEVLKHITIPKPTK